MTKPDASQVTSPSRREAFGLAGAAFGAIWMAGPGQARAEAAAGWEAMSGPTKDIPLHPLSSHSGDAFQALMRYDPESDSDAPYFRSAVPLASRIAPLAATQAHPALDPRAGTATAVTTYRTIARDAPDVLRAVRYGAMPAGGVQVPRRLGANDIVVQWSGTGIIPNPALTDVAHRNGALCLGTIFQPDHRLFDGSVAPVDEVARKLISLARFFGFDGYFVNHENGTAEEDRGVLGLIAAMQAAASRQADRPFHVQLYDGGTDLATLFGAAVGTAPAATSAMLDQGWSGYRGPGGCCSGRTVQAATIASEARMRGRSPFDVFYGLQLYPGPGFLGAAAPLVISPNAGDRHDGGLQLYSLDDGLLNLMRARQDGKGAAFLPPDLDIPGIEQLVYSGQSGNPALNNAPTLDQQRLYDQRFRYSEGATANGRPSHGLPDQADLPITYGVANFIAERSVVGSLPWVTHFNTGEGQRFFIEGRQVGAVPWFNLGIQDVLPTWQWWRAPYEGLADRTGEPAGLLQVGFDQTLAYDGGTSLRVHGDLGDGSATRIHLFKTDLRIPLAAGEPVIHVTTHATAADRSRSRVGLIFADRPDVVAWLPLHGGGGVNDPTVWRDDRLDLRRFRGRSIAAILLGFKPQPGRPAPIDIRFGRLAVLSGTEARPPAPTRLRLERRGVDSRTGATGLGLEWQGQGRFDLFRRTRGQERIWLGRIDGTAFYAADAVPTSNAPSIIQVEAVSGAKRGRPASVKV